MGEGFDNAMCESFFATLGCECPDRQGLRTQRGRAGMAGFDFIEGFYNPHRCHSAPDYESPVNYEVKRVQSCCMIASGQPSMKAGQLQ